MKKIILSLTLFFTVAAVSAQSFMHGAGVTVFVGSSPETKTTVGYGLTYSPRFNFLETESFSVSVGVPLSAGISFSTSLYSNSYDDDISLGVVLNAPIIVNLNMGRGSTKDNRQKFGFFVGAGAGYYHGDFIDSYDNTYSINALGPAGNAGVRLGVGRKHKNIEIRLSYMKGINDNKRTGDDGFGNLVTVNEKPNVYGIACLFNF